MDRAKQDPTVEQEVAFTGKCIIKSTFLNDGVLSEKSKT
jgi:hypothetical protein